MTTEATEAAEVVESVTLTQRERDDMTVVECLLDAGFEIENPIGWWSEGSAFVFGVRGGGNRNKFEHLVGQRIANASGHVETDRRGKVYAVVTVEPTPSEWDEIVADNANMGADSIRNSAGADLDEWPKVEHSEAVRRLNLMTDAEVVALFKRLNADGKLHWELNKDDIFPHWDFHFSGLEPGDIR